MVYFYYLYRIKLLPVKMLKFIISWNCFWEKMILKTKRKRLKSIIKLRILIKLIFSLIHSNIGSEQVEEKDKVNWLIILKVLSTRFSPHFIGICFFVAKRESIFLMEINLNQINGNGQRN